MLRPQMTQRQMRFVTINLSCIMFMYFSIPVFFTFVLVYLQKLYIVCDVALFVIANKSTSCHLDSPKDPVLPSKFFTPPDKVTTTLTAVTLYMWPYYETHSLCPSLQDFINDKEYLSPEAKIVLQTGKIQVGFSHLQLYVSNTLMKFLKWWVQ